jgi:hypothetical protein
LRGVEPGKKSRITWLRLGDANTKYFHLMANARKTKNFIHSLYNGSQEAVTHREKRISSTIISFNN